MQTSEAATDGDHPVRTVDSTHTAGAVRDTDEWPVVPPVPTPTPPPPAHLGPEPPVIGRPAPYEPPPATSTPVPTRLFRAPVVARAGATVALRTRAPRRPIVVPSRADNQVWQPRFAYTAAALVMAGFAVVALPVWLALYRSISTPDGTPTHILPLGMMLLGGFLTSVAAWVVIVELRARVRMVDALGRTGEHEAPGAAGISAFTGLLRPFVQIPAQIALLAVALALFVGATILAF